METSILTALEELRYPDKVANEKYLSTRLQDQIKFSELIAWCSKELSKYGKIEETVNSIDNLDNVSSFQMELSSLLKELNCPWTKIMDGDLAKRFDPLENRLIALKFLIEEVQCCKIHYINNPKQLKVEISESQTGKNLREIAQTLGLGKPPDNITIKDLVVKIKERMVQRENQVGGQNKLLFDPLLVALLSEKQWEQLEQLQQQMQEEYKLRREMLLKRIDVTIESFHWSDRLKKKSGDINRIYASHRPSLDQLPNVSISDIVAARSDLVIIEKTSSALVRRNTKSSVNKVVIGRVPDRGGRTNEMEQPPPEMPAWQQRQGAPAGSTGWAPRGSGQGQGHQRGGRGGGGDHRQQSGDAYQQNNNQYGGRNRDNSQYSNSNYNYNQERQQQQSGQGYANESQYHQPRHSHQQQQYGQGYNDQQHYQQHDDRGGGQQQHRGRGGGGGYQGQGHGRVQGGWNNSGRGQRY